MSLHPRSRPEPSISIRCDRKPFYNSSGRTSMHRNVPVTIVFLYLALSSCEKPGDPLSPPPSSPFIDWEGHYPAINSAYADSVLFTSDRYIGTSFAPSVYIMHKSGRGIHALINQWFTFGASWSPRRWKILFIADTSWDKPARGVYTMDVDGSHWRRLTPLNQDVYAAAWSPDGNTIAYIEINRGDPYGGGRVDLINPDGTNIIALTGLVRTAPACLMVAGLPEDRVLRV